LDIYDILFFLTTIWIGPFWIAMLIYPYHELTEKMMDLHWSFMGPIFIWLLVVISDPGSLIEAGKSLTEGGMKPENIMESLVNLLGTRSGAAAAWSHMVAGDIFITRWMWRRCIDQGREDWIRWISVFFGVMLMPLGVILHVLLTRKENN